MSTYSTNLKIELIGTGEQTGTWGTTTNSNFANVFEQAIVGRVTVNYATDANKTLSTSDSVASQDFRNVYLNLTSGVSLTTTRELVVPTINKNYVVQNNTTGGQSITVKTSAGTGITVPNGATCAVYVDGTNVIQSFDYLPTLTIPTLNVTTLDLTNIEVTNIKAKDGTASASIANSTGVMTINSSVLTTTDINGGTIDSTSIGASSASSGAFTTLSASGVATFSAGTVSAPAITTTGDTNTGIFFPAADTIAFSEGGVESMRIDSSGRLGIGTTNPSQRLQVENNFNGSTWAYINNSTAGTGAGSGILLGTDTNAAAGAIFQNSSLNTDKAANALRIRNLLSAPIVFEVNATEYMRITSTGNVGIGTNSPATLLHASSAGDSVAYATSSVSTAAPFSVSRVQNTNSTDGTPTLQTFFISGNGGGLWYHGAVGGGGGFGSYVIGNRTSTSAYSERLRIDNAGNLGLGVTPSAWNAAVAFAVGNGALTGTVQSGSLDLVNNVYFNGSSYLYRSTNFATFYRQTVSGAHLWYQAPSGTAGAVASFTQAMTLDASGNLLVGTTTGSSRLNIQSDNPINIYNAAGTNQSNIDFDGAQVLRIRSYHASGSNLTFATNPSGGANTERMRITSTGAVCIGTTSPSYVAANRGNLNIAGSSGAILGFQMSGVAQGYVFHNGTDFQMWNEKAGPVLFATNALERMRIDSSGNVGIGTTTPDIFGRGYTRMLTVSSSGSSAVQINAATGNTAWVDFGVNASRVGAIAVSSSIFELGTSGAVPVGLFTNSNYRLYITSGGDVGIGTTSPQRKLHIDGGGSATYIQLSNTASGSTNNDGFQLVQDGVNCGLINREAGYMSFDTSNTERMRIDSSGNVLVNSTSNTYSTRMFVNGLIADTAGNVRAIPQNAQTGAYTLVVGDVGKHISITTGGVTCNASIFSAGDAVTIYNNSGSNQTITAGTNVTFRLAGTATTGNRTLAQYGVATLLCVTGGANPVFVVSGAGVT